MKYLFSLFVVLGSKWGKFSDLSEYRDTLLAYVLISVSINPITSFFLSSESYMLNYIPSYMELDPGTYELLKNIWIISMITLVFLPPFLLGKFIFEQKYRKKVLS